MQNRPERDAQTPRHQAMSEITDFGVVVLAVSASLFVALLCMRLADRASLPYAALILAATAIVASASTYVQSALSVAEVQDVATVALVVILFDGGFRIGATRLRRSLRPILSLGIVGTFLTAGVVAVAARYVLGFSWIEAGLVGAAIAPTDPAVTFSVFAGREIRGRSGTILQGEAGMNDPVGIALMIGMIELAQESDGSFWIVVREFVVEMSIGLAVGIAGGLLAKPVLSRLRLTGLALYPIRMLAVAGIVYGIASVAQGSGFLAVFVAGVLLGDVSLLRKGEIESFLSSVGVLAEIAVFIALGLTVAEADLGFETWVDGIVLAVTVAFVARPLAVVPLLLPERLTQGERLFVAWGGLKGAVPILLGALALVGGVDHASTVYGIVFVVVLFSVIVQGSTVPYVARRFRIRFRRVDHDLAEVREFVVAERSFANGRRIRELPLGERAWLGVVVRDGHPRATDDKLVLAPGDRVHVYAQPEDGAALERIFTGTPGTRP
jgi:potassium/hydrogen antiporter